MILENKAQTRPLGLSLLQCLQDCLLPPFHNIVSGVHRTVRSQQMSVSLRTAVSPLLLQLRAFF